MEKTIREKIRLELMERNITIETHNLYKKLIEIERREAQKEFFDKFDEYSCIKNDKWYLDYKKEFQDNKEENITNN